MPVAEGQDRIMVIERKVRTPIMSLPTRYYMEAQLISQKQKKLQAKYMVATQLHTIKYRLTLCIPQCKNGGPISAVNKAPVKALHNKLDAYDYAYFSMNIFVLMPTADNLCKQSITGWWLVEANSQLASGTQLDLTFKLVKTSM